MVHTGRRLLEMELWISGCGHAKMGRDPFGNKLPLTNKSNSKGFTKDITINFIYYSLNVIIESL